MTHATIYGLGNATFGMHERKPSGTIQSKSNLRFLILNNCHASAECLGYLLNKLSQLRTIEHRAPLRKIYSPSILPNLVPDEFVGYLADYCPHLTSLDMDVGNRYSQHGLDTDSCDIGIEVASFNRLESLTGELAVVEL